MALTKLKLHQIEALTGASVYVPVSSTSRVLSSETRNAITTGWYYDFNLVDHTVDRSYVPGYVDNSTIGGSGLAVSIPANATHMVVNVSLNVDISTGSGGVVAYAAGVSVGLGPMRALTHEASFCAGNAAGAPKSVNTGLVLVEMDDPADPLADLRVDYSFAPVGITGANVTTTVRIFGFLVPVSLP